MRSLTLSCTARFPMHAASLRSLILCVAVVLCAGCAKPTLYSWGDYDESLEQRYEKENIAQAEQLLRDQMLAYADGQRVPPGVYADYAFLLFRRGDLAGAVFFFEKEKKTFPESALLMNKLIERIRKQAAQQETVNVSALTEGGRP
jgi:hypothetical protein